MDYTVAAPKVLCAQLKLARPTSGNSYSLSGLLFQRAWVQGVLVSRDPFLLDDGSGIIELAGDLRTLALGAYFMVLGSYLPSLNHLPIIKVHKVVDLSMFPDREAMWYLEVIEAFKLFYQPIGGA